MVREHTTEHTEIMDRIVTHIGLPSIPDWRRRGGAGSSPPNPGTRDPPGRARARREVRRPQQILFWRAERTCGRIHEALCLECAVSALRRRPRGLRLAEEVQQLPLSELSERCVGTLGSQRRIASKAALALGAGPKLEQQHKLILPINADAARGINLPDLAVYYDGASCHQAERLRGREYNR